MAGIDTLQLVAWALSVGLQLCLLVILVYRRHYRQFPAFTIYLAAVMLQNIADYFTYRHWDFRSSRSLAVAWSIQAVITVLRVMAVFELCKLVFQDYRGIWLMLSRVMAVTFAVVACAAMILSGGAGTRILSSESALGLALATAVVVLFLSARYYQVQASEPIRAMAVGFFLYACFIMLNDVILKIWLVAYASLWNFLGILAFISSLLVWSWALRRPLPLTQPAPELLAGGVYLAISPEVNLRLRSLNDRLSHLFERRAERQ